MTDSGDETEWELAAEKFAATVVPKEVHPSQGKESTRASRSTNVVGAPSNRATATSNVTAGQPAQKHSVAGTTPVVVDNAVALSHGQRASHGGASTRSGSASVGRSNESSAGASQGIQVLRYSSDASLTSTVRGGTPPPQVLWDRARVAYESALRRNANRTELEALSAALMAVGVDVSGCRGVPQRNTTATTNGPSASGGGRRSAAAVGTGSGGAARTSHPPLTRSHNAWTPSFLSDTAETGSTDLEGVVASTRRRAKAILNKLVPEKFVTLAEQILDLPLHRYAVLEALISEIFDKALAEPYFCGVYADLCEVLNRALPSIAVENRPGASSTNFRKMLLARCQEEFVQRALAPEDRLSAEHSPDEDEREALARSRRRTLGNTIFVGELFKRHLLSEKIIHECVQMLLKERENEDSIETLAKLLSVAGGSMDRPEARPYMDAYFAKIEEMASNPQIRARYRFMLKDCIELRKQKWKPRRAPERPATLEEIHGKKSGRAARQSSQSLARKAAQLRFTGADTEAARGSALPSPPLTTTATKDTTGASTEASTKTTRRRASDGRVLELAAQDAALLSTDDKTDLHGPEHSPVRAVANTEQVRALIRGIVEDYMANPCAEEAHRALHESGLLSQPEVLGAVGVQELFYMACSARGSLRQPLVRAFSGAFHGVIPVARLVGELSATASRLLDIEDELDMPTASSVFGECAALLWTNCCATTSDIGDFARTVIEATPKPRRASLLISFLETLWRQNPCGVREQYLDSLRTLHPVVRSFSTDERTTLDAFLLRNDLIDWLPELAIRERLRTYLEPGAEQVTQAADWLKAFLSSARQMMNTDPATGTEITPRTREWYALCRYTAEHILLVYVTGSGERDIMDIMRRLRQFIPLLQQTAGGDIDVDEWRQAQVAFAVQAACNQLDFPPELMSGMFHVLYDADVISEEAFDRWREDVHDPSPGKTKALFHVNAFLNWLKEADDEEPETVQPATNGQ